MRLSATPSAYSSYGENESNADSNESCNIQEGGVEHNSTTEFTFLDGSASDQKLKNQKGKITLNFKP